MTARWREAAWWVAAAAAATALPFVFPSDSSLAVLTLAAVAVVYALSYNILLGRTGLLSFGHAVFFGLGGFGVVHLMNAIPVRGWPIPLPVVPLFGGLFGLMAGLVFGGVACLRGGIVFTMVTFGLGELVESAAPILVRFFGGEEGVNTDRFALPHLFGLGFGQQIEVYYLVAAWTLACAAAMRFVGGTAFGQVARAARENPERVEFIGYSMRRVRFTAVAVSSFFAGVAGALTAVNFEIMTVNNVGAGQSTGVVLATFIGGIDWFVGPVIGAVLLTSMQVVLSDVTAGWPFYIGLVFVLTVMYAPGGLAGLLLSRPLRETLAPGRLLLLLPVASVAAGTVLAVEMGYQLGRGTGSVRHLAGLDVDAASAWAWLLAAVLVVGGAAVLHRAAGGTALARRGRA